MPHNSSCDLGQTKKNVSKIWTFFVCIYIVKHRELENPPTRARVLSQVCLLSRGQKRAKVAKHKIPNSKFQNPKIRIPDSTIQIPNTNSKTRIPNSKIQNPKSKLQNPNSTFENSIFQHPKSNSNPGCKIQKLEFGMGRFWIWGTSVSEAQFLLGCFDILLWARDQISAQAHDNMRGHVLNPATRRGIFAQEYWIAWRAARCYVELFESWCFPRQGQRFKNCCCCSC